MNRTLPPGRRSGTVEVPASKSQAHRLLICAALGRAPVTLRCRGISGDIAATIACLGALGADIAVRGDGIRVKPIGAVPAGVRHLPCGESGSTLRFLLPVAGALGAEAVFHLEGRLPQRPIAPLLRALTARGMTLRLEGETLTAAGRLRPGTFSLPGNVSSQYLSGLMMALPLLPGDSRLAVEGTLESGGYVDMTRQILERGGVRVEASPGSWDIPGNQCCALPPAVTVEGDWSGAAFFLCMGALSPEGVTVRGLDLASAQGDRAVLEILRAMGAEVAAAPEAVTVRQGGPLRPLETDAGPIPDLIPVLCAAAAGAVGDTRIFNAGRLRLKESDRLRATARLLTALGGSVEEGETTLVIRGAGRLTGGVADACGDHRIAMSAAVAACICRRRVTVTGSGCVEKSYPAFWRDFEALKGETP